MLSSSVILRGLESSSNLNDLVRRWKNVLLKAFSISYFLVIPNQAVSPVEVGSSPAPAPAIEEKPKEDGEDFEGLAAVLEHLGLSDFKTTFEDEQIDLESFVRKKSAMYSTLGSVSCVLNVLYKSTLPAYLR